RRSRMISPMTLRSQLRFCRAAFYPLVLGAMAAVAVPGLLLDLQIALVLWATCAAGVAVLVAWRPLVYGWLAVAARRRGGQVNAARTDGDDATLERLGGELEEFYRDTGRPTEAAYTRA